VLKSAIEDEVGRIGNLDDLVGKRSMEARQIVLGLPLQIANPKINGNGQLEFTVYGELSGTLRLDRSADLKEWRAVDIAPVNELPTVLRDQLRVDVQQRYYRVILLP
jgi:hypothetical protein